MNIDTYMKYMLDETLKRFRTNHGKKNDILPAECEKYVKGYFELLKERMKDSNVTSVFFNEEDTLVLRRAWKLVGNDGSIDLKRYRAVCFIFNNMVFEDVNAKTRYALSKFKMGDVDAFSEYPIGIGELGLDYNVYSYLHSQNINLVYDFSKKSRNIIFSIKGISDQEALRIIDLIHSVGGFFADDQALFSEALGSLGSLIRDLNDLDPTGESFTSSDIFRLSPHINALIADLQKKKYGLQNDNLKK